MHALLGEIELARGGDARLDAEIDALYESTLKPRLSIWQIINMNVGFFGIQFSFGVFMPEIDEYFSYPGETNSARYPLYGRADFRIDKTWTARSSRWTLYLDVYNATSHPNPLLTSYNWDYSEHETRGWIPILPSLGAEVSF